MVLVQSAVLTQSAEQFLTDGTFRFLRREFFGHVGLGGEQFQLFLSSVDDPAHVTNPD